MGIPHTYNLVAIRFFFSIFMNTTGMDNDFHQTHTYSRRQAVVGAGQHDRDMGGRGEGKREGDSRLILDNDNGGGEGERKIEEAYFHD